MNNDLFLSILAMDSYNRGYGQGLKFSESDSETGQDEVGRSLGNANIIIQSDVASSSSGVEAGFYGLAYDLTGASGFSAGEIVISYRGTNTGSLDALTADVFDGWAVGAGFVGSSDAAIAGRQGALAVNFYNAVANQFGTSTDPRFNNITTTGHSLGGGLAGLVSSIYWRPATVFDTMTYITGANELASDALSNLETRQSVYGDAFPWLIDGDDVKPYATSGEILDITLRNRLPSKPDIELESFSDLGPIDLHSMALLVNLIWADQNRVTDWQAVGGLLWNAYFSEDIAEALAEEISDFRTTVSDDISILQSAIAYSAIDEGERPFGDVAIRSMFNDAGELGRTIDKLPSGTGSLGYGKALSEIIVEFAGLMALRDVEFANLGVNDPNVLGGALKILGQEIIIGQPEEVALQVNLSDELWSVGAGPDDEDHEIRGKEELIEDLVFSSFASGDASLADLKAWYGSEISSSGLLESIDEAVFSLKEGTVFRSDGDDVLPGLALQIGTVAADNVSFGEGDHFLFAERGDDIVSGNNGVDILYGGIGNDTLSGGEGKDWLSGGTGLDTLSGGAGDDRIYGGEQDDTIHGGDDDDRIEGNSGEDTIFGDTGDDIIDGGTGKDRLFGGIGEDRILGGDEDDEINGGRDNDILIGAGGSDTILGGQGNDILDANQQDSDSDFLDGGEGNDRFLVNNGDIIDGLDAGDRVKLGDRWLNGGERGREPEELSCDDPGVGGPGPDEEEPAVYFDRDGTRYTLDGTTLTVSGDGGTITIRNFRNGMGGIQLREQPADTDAAQCPRDPLVIDLNLDGQVITSIADSGAYFDIDSDGFAERMAWVNASDGLLVRDQNGNGIIDNGMELFGDARDEFIEGELQQVGLDGFSALRLLDSNGDGQISNLDVDFDQLKLWIDADGNAETDEGELVSLDSYGIVSIGLQTFDTNIPAQGTSHAPLRSVVEYADGSFTNAYDAFLSVDQYDVRETVSVDISTEGVADLPFLLGTGTTSNLDVAMARDPALEEMVRSLAELPVDQADEILGRVQQILLRWTGADQVEPDSRGININAQWLSAIERLSGQDFVQARIGSIPRGDAATILINEWREIVSRTAANLVGQTALGDSLTPGMRFAAAAFYQVDGGTSLGDILTQMASNAPASRRDSTLYWSAMVAILDPYQEEFGLSDTEFEAQLKAAIEAADLPVGLVELRLSLTGTGEGEVTGGTRSTVESGVLFDSKDLLIAGSETTSLNGGGGNDAYVVGPTSDIVTIKDNGGADRLHFADSNEADLTVTIESFEGEDYLRISDEVNVINTRVRYSVSANGFQSEIETVQFANGDIRTISDLLSGAVVSGNLIVGSSDAGTVLEGDENDNQLFGFGPSDEYRFGPGGGNDRISDAGGANDRLVLNASQSAVSFAIGEGSTFGDVVATIGSTGEAVRIVGQRSSNKKVIETIEFSDGLLTAQDLDDFLNTGTAGDDLIYGSSRDDLIIGLGGNDVLRGGEGLDVYEFQLGWGSDRIVDASLGNVVRFGDSINSVDVSAARGGDGNADLVLTHVNGDTITVANALSTPTLGSLSFADGSSRSLLDLILEIDENGSGIISGTGFDDAFAGTAASEILIGNGGNDTYAGNGGIDFYDVGTGRAEIQTSPVGIDIVLAPENVSLADFRFYEGGAGFATFRFDDNLPNNSVFGELDFVRFSDGSEVDFTTSRQTDGTDGDDFLFQTGSGTATFTPGAGNDVIIGSARNNGVDIYEFASGFGQDIIYDMGGQQDQIRFTSPELTQANAEFERRDLDLVISFANTGDQLTVEGYFWNYPFSPDTQSFGERAGIIESFEFADGFVAAGTLLTFISSSTDGDDVVMTGTGTDNQAQITRRNGGAGNDLLIGGDRQNVYDFDVGFGHDIIKDSSPNAFATSSSFVDAIFFGSLASSDVSISRNPDDPLSIIFTVIATGETLTIDGTPNDGFNQDQSALSGTMRGGLNIERFIFTDATLLRDDVIDAALANEGTGGDDVVTGLNSTGRIDPGSGNDTIHILHGSETLVIRPNGGHDIVDFLQYSFTDNGFAIEFDGISLDDIVLYQLGEYDGVVGQHLRIETDAGSTLTILNGRDTGLYPRSSDFGTAKPLFTAYSTEDPNFRIPFVGQTGRLTGAKTVGSNSDDILQTNPNDTATPIDPGAGNDLIFGTNGRHTLLFDIGYGTDRYESDPLVHPLLPIGFQPNTGLVDIVVGSGLTSTDMTLQWLANEPGKMELLINGTEDRLIFNPDNLGSIVLTDTTLTTVPVEPILVNVNPGQTIDTSMANEIVTAINGDARLQFGNESGVDSFADTRFNEAVTNSGDLAGWSGNTVELLNSSGNPSLDQFEFIQDIDNPSDLVVRNIASGAQLRIENQFGFGLPEVIGGWSSLDIDGDDLPDFDTIDTDANGRADFAAIDSDGDGELNWVNPDFDGDGNTDWEIEERNASFDTGGLGAYEISVEDINFDGNGNEYFLDGSVPVSLRDLDGDGVPDQYTLLFGATLPAPTDRDGTINWLLLDADGDGVADLAPLDTDGDGNLKWFSGYQPGSPIVGWTAEELAELYDLDDNFVAARSTSDGSPTVYLFETGNSGLLLARDIDGDGVPDEYAIDSDFNGQPDSSLVPGTPTMVEYFAISSSFGETLHSMLDILPRLELRTVPSITGGDGTFVDLESLKPVASDQADTLVLGTDEEIDSLAGNDIIWSVGQGGTLRFGAGDGNDQFAATDIFARLIGNSADIGDTVIFDGILDPGQVRFLRGGGNGADLIVEILATGERLTIKDQLVPENGVGSSAAQPPVKEFHFEGGLILSAGEVTRRLGNDDGSNPGPNGSADGPIVSDNQGGVLGGDEGDDELRGGTGDDIYLFERGSAEDVILDAGGFDIVQFGEDITPADLYFSRTGPDGSDLLVEVLGLDRLALTISGQFANSAQRIENFTFVDGSVLDWRDVQQFILDTEGTGRDDTITGFEDADIIRGRGGNDEIEGAGGDDRIFGGSGRDAGVFTGLQSDYSITEVDGVTIVTDNVADRDGTDRLVDIEDLIFLGDSSSLALADPNNAPLAGAFAVNASEDNDVVILKADLLAATSDPDGDALAIVELSQFENGSAWIGLDGNIRFRPDANFAGEAGFDYRVSDGQGGFASARVSVTVSAINDAPIANQQVINFSSAEDAGISFDVPADTFSDADGDMLTLTATLDDGSDLPAWLSFENGTFQGTPPQDFNGVIDLTLSASDGTSSTNVNVNLEIVAVNDAPIVVALPQDVVARRGEPFSFAITDGVFVDPEGDPLTFTLTTSNGGPLPDWLSFNGSELSGTLEDQITQAITLNIYASDGRAAALTSFSLTPIFNSAPILAKAIADANSDEDTALDIVVPLDTFTDVDGDALTLSATLTDGAALPAWLVFDGERFTGTPPQDFNGIIDLTVTASDGEFEVSDSFSLTIDPVNDAPVLAAMISDQVSPEDQAIDFAVPAGTFADVDGNSLTLSATLTDGSDLPIWLNFDGTRFTGQPPQDFNGVIDIALTASDGEFDASDLFALSISPVNDPPVVLTPLSDVSSDEDVAVDIPVPTDTFADVDGDTLTLTATLSDGSDLPAWIAFDGSRLTGTPPQDFNGDIDIAITASDGELDTVDHFVLTIDPVNDAPVVLNPIADANSAEDAMVNIALPSNVFSDVDGDALALTASLADGSDLPAWLSFDGARFTGTPPLDFNGTLTIDVSANDGELEVTDSFALTIDPVNDGPVIAAILNDQGSDEDTAVSFAVPDDAFTDVDGDALQLTATLSDGSDLPDWLTFDGTNFTGTPPVNFNGNIALEVTASDGVLSASQNFSLVINPVNDAPVVSNPLTDQNSQEDTAFEIAIPADTFSDVDGDTLVLNALLTDGTNLPDWIAFDGERLTGTPPQDFNGMLNIRITASDGELSVSDDFSLTIDPQNDAPILSQPLQDAQSNEDTDFSIALPQDAFVDADGDILTLSAELVDGSPLPEWITFDGGQFTGTPPQDFNGFLDIEVTASDGSLEASDSFLFTIDPVNDAPIAVNDDIFLSEGGAELTIQQSSLLDNDIDVDGDTLAVTSVTNGANGAVGFDADGNIVYTPNSGFQGEDSFTYTVTDGELTSTASVQLRVDDPFSGWRQGTEGNDYLFGNFFRVNEIFGRGGNDWIFGGFRQDYLAGGDGNDRIFGLFGNDHLWGNAGNDRLYGGFGTDTAYFSGDSADYELQTQYGGFYVRIRDELPGVDGNDGRDQLFSIERLAFSNETISVSSPIILDLDGNGTRFVSADESEALFDLDGDGVRDDTAWISSGDAFLFLDRNGDGYVSGVNEISFVDDVEDARSDLDGLKSFDSNGDGLLSATDDRFGEFGVWQDLDTDGEVDAGETFTLDQSGIESIDLNATPTEAGFSLGGVAVANQGTFNWTDGTSGSFADAAITFFEQGTPELPEIDFVSQTYNPTSSKYRIHAVDGELMVGSKRSAETALAGASILTIGKRTRGYLTPIILDLDGDGVEMRRWKKSRAMFDMDGDGSRDNVGWTGKGDGFLVIDRNNNGVIDNGSELSFLVENPNAKSDLQALSALDSNGDGIISSLDVRFRELKIWVDANDNGETDAGELRTLDDHGIASFNLAGQATNERVKFGQNILLATSSFTRTDGSTGQVGDAALAFKPAGPVASASQRSTRFEASPDASAELASLRAGRQNTQPNWGGQGLQFDIPEGVSAFDYFEQTAQNSEAQDSLGAANINSVSSSFEEGNVEESLNLAVPENSPGDNSVVDISIVGGADFGSDGDNRIVAIKDDTPETVAPYLRENMLAAEYQGGPEAIDPDILKLAIMTQDMSTFGATWAVESTNQEKRQMAALDFFAG